MRKIFILLVLLFPVCMVNGQLVEKIAGESVEEGIHNVERLLHQQIPDSVCLVGVGDVSSLSRQSVQFNTALMAYLISKRGFRQVFLVHEDWLMRPLNEYLRNDKRLDTDRIDSLMAVSLVHSVHRTNEFKSFLIWLKKYNLQHKEDPVDVLGVGSDDPIPVSYFLATYIVPLDKERGLSFARKWYTDNFTEDQTWADIKRWYDLMRRDRTFFNSNPDLLLQMKEDIDRNDRVKKALSPGLGLPESVNDRLRLIADWVLEKIGNKAILYSDNGHIARSGYVLSYTITGTSPGLLLHNRLKGNYYASLTDFRDSAFLNALHPDVSAFKKSIIVQEEHVKKLFQNKELSYYPEDTSSMSAYIPKSMGVVIGDIRTSVPCPGIVPSDAIFFFRTLTPTSFINSFKVKYMD